VLDLFLFLGFFGFWCLVWDLGQGILALEGMEERVGVEGFGCNEANADDERGQDLYDYEDDAVDGRRVMVDGAH
jgi:hypothetical protein